MKIALFCPTIKKESIPNLIKKLIKAMQNIGLNPILLLDNDFKVEDKSQNLKEKVKLLSDDLTKKFAFFEYVMLFDFLLNGNNLIYNLVLKETIKHLPQVKFISFHKDKPDNFGGLFDSFSNTTYIFSSINLKDLYQKTYLIPDKSTIVSPLLIDSNINIDYLSEYFDIVNTDYLALSVGASNPNDRLDSVASFLGILKCISFKKVKLIICDRKRGVVDQKGKNIIKLEGYKNGLELSDILFTSDLGYDDGFPSDAIIELMGLSNIFIASSFSESIPLLAITAQSKNNLIIFNETIDELKELGKTIESYQLDLGFPLKKFNIYEPTNVIYYTRHAKNVSKLLQEKNDLNAKCKNRFLYSQEFIWKYLEPLLK